LNAWSISIVFNIAANFQMSWNEDESRQIFFRPARFQFFLLRRFVFQSRSTNRRAASGLPRRTTWSYPSESSEYQTPKFRDVSLRCPLPDEWNEWTSIHHGLCCADPIW
jgi:hypothetical protein